MSSETPSMSRATRRPKCPLSLALLERNFPWVIDRSFFHSKAFNTNVLYFRCATQLRRRLSGMIGPPSSPERYAHQTLSKNLLLILGMAGSWMRCDRISLHYCIWSTDQRSLRLIFDVRSQFSWFVNAYWCTNFLSVSRSNKQTSSIAVSL